MHFVPTMILTVIGMLLAQRALARFATKSFENPILDYFADYAYGLCDTFGWRVKQPEPKDVEGLDRYPEGDNPFIPFITKIVVPSEYARQQVALACRYLHDQMTTDTDYMAVNFLVHLYADEEGEPSGKTPWIVVE